MMVAFIYLMDGTEWTAIHKYEEIGENKSFVD